jgi:hypothetical protein
VFVASVCVLHGRGSGGCRVVAADDFRLGAPAAAARWNPVGQITSNKGLLVAGQSIKSRVPLQINRMWEQDQPGSSWTRVGGEPAAARTQRALHSSFAPPSPRPKFVSLSLVGPPPPIKSIRTHGWPLCRLHDRPPALADYDRRPMSVPPCRRHRISASNRAPAIEDEVMREKSRAS